MPFRLFPTMPFTAGALAEGKEADREECRPGRGAVHHDAPPYHPTRALGCTVSEITYRKFSEQETSCFPFLFFFFHVYGQCKVGRPFKPAIHVDCYGAHTAMAKRQESVQQRLKVRTLTVTPWPRLHPDFYELSIRTTSPRRDGALGREIALMFCPWCLNGIRRTCVWERLPLGSEGEITRAKGVLSFTSLRSGGRMCSSQRRRPELSKMYIKTSYCRIPLFCVKSTLIRTYKITLPPTCALRHRGPVNTSH